MNKIYQIKNCKINKINFLLLFAFALSSFAFGSIFSAKAESPPIIIEQATTSYHDGKSLLNDGACYAVVYFKDDKNFSHKLEDPFSFEHLFLRAASTEKTRAKGLMHQQLEYYKYNLKTGMIFDFGKEKTIHMWMKNTPSPLDMIFLNEDGKVVDIKTNTNPYSKKILTSKQKARYVLETATGYVKGHNIKNGYFKFYKLKDIVRTPC